jgi:hypothetical protein
MSGFMKAQRTSSALNAGSEGFLVTFLFFVLKIRHPNRATPLGCGIMMIRYPECCINARTARIDCTLG